MKKWIVLIAILACFSVLSAQDQMILKSGTTLKVKILKSNSVSVDYNQPEIHGDSILTKDKSEILALIFENGYTEVIDGTTKKNKEIINYPTNKIAFDVFGFLGREVHFHYEKLIAKGAVAIRLPLGIIYNYDDGNSITFFPLRNRFSLYEDISYGSSTSLEEKSAFGFHSGIGAVVYFNQPKKVRGYIVPEIVLGVLSRKYDLYKTSYNDYGEYESFFESSKTYTGMIIGTDFNVGLSVLAAPKFSVGLEAGGGYGTFIQKNKANDRVAIWRMSLLMGFNWDKMRAK